MRNPWLYIKMMKDAPTGDDVTNKTEVHDFIMTYYN